jgi:hypothetical protein
MSEQATPKEESAIMRFLRKFLKTPKGNLYTKAGEKAGLMKKEVVEGASSLVEKAMKIPDKLLGKEAAQKRYRPFQKKPEYLKRQQKQVSDYKTRSVAAGLGASALGTTAAKWGKSIPNTVMVAGIDKDLAKFTKADPTDVAKLKSILKTDAEVHVWKNKVPVSLGFPSRGTQPIRGVAFNREISQGRVDRALRRGQPKPIKNLVAVSPDMNKLPIIAHELGHSAKAFRMPAGKLLYAVGRKAPMVGALVAGFSDPDSKKSKYAPIGVGVASLPLLYEEGRASRLGYGALKKGGFGKDVLKATRSSLGKAYGTYLLAAAGGIGATMLARKARKLLKKREYKPKGVN